VSGIVIIANPNAGGGRHLDEVERHVAGDARFTLRATEGPGDARRLAREAAAEGADVVAAAGGDGTIHEVVAGLAEADYAAALGVIPLGTGNDLARSLAIPTDTGPALALLERGRRRTLDLIRMSTDEGEQLCVNAAAGGFSGQVHDALDPDLKRIWAPLSYLRSAVEVMGDTERWRVRLTVDGREQRLDALNVVVANGRFAGKGIPIAPHADPFDGLLDVAVVGDAPVLRLSRLAPKLLRGEDPGDELFVTARGQQVTLEMDRTMPFSVDGERTECRSAHFTLLPGRLEVVVP
jgi:diacylglycerol kinase (ATP)